MDVDDDVRRRRSAFVWDAASQMVGTLAAAAILFLVAKAAGFASSVSWGRVVAIAAALVAAASLASFIIAVGQPPADLGLTPERRLVRRILAEEERRRESPDAE